MARGAWPWFRSVSTTPTRGRQPGGQHRFDPGDRALPASFPLGDVFVNGRVVRVERRADVNAAPLEARSRRERACGGR
jgi:hypothetical protein